MSAAHDHQAAVTLAIDAARTFSTDAGGRVLAHLRRLTRDRVLGPEASDAQLRHVEGQRALIAHVEGLIERGRNPVPTPINGDHDHD